MIVVKFNNRYIAARPSIIKALARRAGAVKILERPEWRSFSGAVVQAQFADSQRMFKFKQRASKFVHFPILESRDSKLTLSVPCLSQEIIELFLSQIPSRVKEILTRYATVGLSGGRKIEQESTLHALSAAVSLLLPEIDISVGDCEGIDKAARRMIYLRNVAMSPGYGDRLRVRVFRADKTKKQSLVGRSIRCIDSVLKGDGLWLSFPRHACPENIAPSSKWIGGSKSGTWASLALAAGKDLPCLTFMPSDIDFPQHDAWNKFVHLGSNWWYCGE